MSRLRVILGLVLLFVLLASSFAVSAQTPGGDRPAASQAGQQPVYPSRVNGQATRNAPIVPRSIPSVAAPGAAQVSLGQPGTSYRYVKTFGVTGEPYPADVQHFNFNGGIWIDGGNNLYVAEELGFRMLKYNSAGANQLILGHAGIPWHHDDYLSYPKDVVTASNGHTFIIMDPAIKEFDAAGNVVQTIPAIEPWVGGNDEYHFSYPIGIAMNSLGQLFVGDTANHRVQVYDIDSGTGAISYNTTIGTTGVPQSDNSGFKWPTRLAFDSLGRLYVMDTENNRIQRCTNSGGWSCTTFFGETGVWGGDLFHLGYAVGIEIRNDNIFIADSNNYRVLKCTTAGVCTHFAGETGVWGSDNSHFGFINDVAIDSAGNVFVSDSDTSRIQKFTSAGTYLATYGEALVPYLTDNQRINNPWGVAIAGDGGLLVVENAGSRLLKFNAAGAQQWTVGQAGHSWIGDNTGFAGVAGNPAVDAQGRIYVTDSWNQRVQVFDANGNYFTTMGQSQNPGTGNNQFDCPTGAAINPVNGDIVIADTCNNRVQVFTSNRVYKGTLGIPGVAGSDDQHFDEPMGVAVDANGMIFVADNNNFRVQKCTLGTGSFTCSTFAGETGVYDDSFAHVNPTSVAIDKAGRVFIADEYNGRVQVYNANGAYLTTIGNSWGERSNDYHTVYGVAVDNAGNLYTADAWNHRVQKFALGVPGWRQVNINGFGKRIVDQIPSMEVFNNKLYVGTSNYAEGVHHVFSTSNVQDWQEGGHDFQGGVSVLKAFSNNFYAGTWSGLLWKSPDGANWTNVFTLPEGGFASMSEFNGTLYAGTYCGDPAQGASIYQSTNGDNWTPFITGGNGDVNACGVISAATFKGYHYFGIGDWNGGAGMRIWRTDGTNLSEVVDNGFNNPENYAPGGLEAFKNWLYVSVNNPNSYQVWRSDSGNAGSWLMVFETGVGQQGINGHTGLIEYNGQLYLTTYNNWSGVQVWQTSDGVNWKQIGFDGFGDSNNERTEWSNSIAEFNDQLFFGINNYGNGGEVWQLIHQNYLPVINKK